MSHRAPSAMIRAVRAEKTFAIKFSKLGREELPQIDEEYVQKTSSYHLLSDESLETLPLRSETRESCFPTTAFQHHTGSPCQCGKTRKGN